MKKVFISFILFILIVFSIKIKAYYEPCAKEGCGPNYLDPHVLDVVDDYFCISKLVKLEEGEKYYMIGNREFMGNAPNGWDDSIKLLFYDSKQMFIESNDFVTWNSDFEAFIYNSFEMPKNGMYVMCENLNVKRCNNIELYKDYVYIYKANDRSIVEVMSEGLSSFFPKDKYLKSTDKNILIVSNKKEMLIEDIKALVTIYDPEEGIIFTPLTVFKNEYSNDYQKPGFHEIIFEGVNKEGVKSQLLISMYVVDIEYSVLSLKNEIYDINVSKLYETNLINIFQSNVIIEEGHTGYIEPLNPEIFGEFSKCGLFLIKYEFFELNLNDTTYIEFYVNIKNDTGPDFYLSKLILDEMTFKNMSMTQKVNYIIKYLESQNIIATNVKITEDYEDFKIVNGNYEVSFSYEVDGINKIGVLYLKAEEESHKENNVLDIINYVICGITLVILGITLFNLYRRKKKNML